MYHGPYGPRGAESEREDFWTDIQEGSDMMPGVLPGMPADPGALDSEGEPYCPQCPTADDPAACPPHTRAADEDQDAPLGSDPLNGG